MNAVKNHPVKTSLGTAMAVPAQEILSKEFGQGLVLGRLLGESQTEFKWSVKVSADHPLAVLGVSPRAVLRKVRGEWRLELRLDLSTKHDRTVTASEALSLRSAGKAEEANNLAGKARDIVCLDQEEVQAVVSRLSPLAAVRSSLHKQGSPAAWSEQGRSIRCGQLVVKATELVGPDEKKVQAFLARLSALAAVRSGLLEKEIPAAWSERGRSILVGKVVVKATDRGLLIFKNQGEKPVFARTAAKAVQLIVGRTADEQLLAEVTAAAAK